MSVYMFQSFAEFDDNDFKKPPKEFVGILAQKCGDVDMALRKRVARAYYDRGLWKKAPKPTKGKR